MTKGHPQITPPSQKQIDNALEHMNRKRFERGPASKSVQWELHLLHERLSEVAKAYHEGDLQSQRDNVYLALFAVQNFLGRQGFSEATLLPMMRPAIALMEREHNYVDAMFSERKREGTPSRSLDDLQKTGALAALANFWIEARSQDGTTINERLRLLTPLIAGEWLGRPDVQRLRAARDLVSSEARSHSSVKWANTYAGWLAEHKSQYGYEGAIRMVAALMNRHLRSAFGVS